MDIYARQGDLIIERLKAPITGDLVKTKALTFAGDSSGHPHTLTGAVEYRRDGLRTFVRVTAKRTIEHGKADGHKPVALLPAKGGELGDYEVRPKRERGDGSDRAVED